MNPILRNILIGAGAIFAVGFLINRARKSVGPASIGSGLVTGSASVVGGTVEGLGEVADTVTGGALGRAGSAIGEFFSGSFFDRRTVDDLTTGPVPEFVGPPAPDG